MAASSASAACCGDVSRAARAALASAGPRSRAAQARNNGAAKATPRLAFSRVARGGLASGRTLRRTVVLAASSGQSSSSSSESERDASAAAAAAAAGRLAPLDVGTTVGAELDEIMKTDPVAFEGALKKQLRAWATEVSHASSFPGGVRQTTSNSSSRSDSASSRAGGASTSIEDFDFREAAGLGPAAPPPEYLTLEGLLTDADDAAAADCPPSDDAAADRALLQQLSARIAAGAKAQRRHEVQDAIYLQVVHRFNHLGVPLAPNPAHYCGPMLASAPSPRRHMQRIARLREEILPSGAEELLSKHLASILANVDDPEISGRVGAAGVPAVTLAQVYSQSAVYGYFLQGVSQRLQLERTFEMVECISTVEESFAAYARDRPLMPDNGVDGGSGAAAAAGVASGYRFAAPRAGGGSFGPRQQRWHSQPPTPQQQQQQRQQRQRQLRERDAAADAALGPLDWEDEEDSEDEEEDCSEMVEEAEDVNRRRRGGGGGGGVPRPVPLQLHEYVNAMDPQLRAAAARIVGMETTAVLEDHVSALFGPAKYLSARLAAAISDPTMSGAGGGGGGGPISARDAAVRVQRAAMNGDVDVVRMPLDALRYLVVEAVALGAALHGAEKVAEDYELLHPWAANVTTADDADGFSSPSKRFPLE
eukprot:CAMPEP_0197578270 /NCGR_PEP_ID=MMETSP1326-20131121/2560_1 /TAXON_ID=1155430 /ORGANISM="Genus nov. species nov., Strain RCC2288" /LENGTH=650 /DNA_ID=CAMNT_0043141439 /DNA_START=192 /DNA_END=2144 /DNA_ORIENTATION=-